ncbi:flagellin [Oscillospiraceae bacterium MB08-C2-2]|nr:flagellin [Oscillospiraceae bacterium MB08-C2-2]
MTTMNIRLNKPAATASRVGQAVNRDIAKNLEKLASGSRINRAADNAAGLAISEKMRTQIRGLDMGAKNTQHAAELLKTADGALSEVTSMMQRMRELAVQAANGTYDEADRQAIQAEVSELTSAIQDVSTSLNFNQKQLLDGSVHGDYGYSYGIKESATITPKDPAVIKAGEAFEGRLHVASGTNAEINSSSYTSSYLNSLNGPPPNFPLEGVFAIQVQTPEHGTVNAVLDFGTENADGDFSLDQFEAFFQDQFQGLADFSITASGDIQMKTTSLGGNQTKIIIGINNTATLGLPSGTRFVNSSLFGASPYQSYNATIGAKTSRALTAAEVAALQSAPGVFNSSQVLNSTLLWSLLPASTSFSFAIEKRTSTNPLTWQSVPGSTQSFSKSGNLSGATNLSDVRAYLNNPANNNSDYFNSSSVIPSVSIDRDGFAYVSFTGSTSVNSDYSSNPPYRSAFIYNPATANHSAYASSPVITSAYTAAVSEEIGTLTISIGNVPGVSPAPSVTVDFGTMDFANTQAMIDYINQRLNATAPVPAPKFTNSTYNAAFPVAQAYIDSNGYLAVRAAEREFSIGITEKESDKPMFSKTSFGVSGQNWSNRITITDDSGDQTFINIKPGDYNGINDFITQNSANFSPKYILGTNEAGNSLVITSAGAGAEYTVSNISLDVIPSTTESNIYMQSVFQKLGFGTPGLNVYQDGVTHPAIPDLTKALWIQTGANQGDGLYIGIPRLDAYDLGLLIKAADHANSGAYQGISQQLGTDNYSSALNVEPDGYGLDVTSHEKAAGAISILDNAINIVSTERAQLGAVANRLEHTLNYNGTTQENITAAESAIRDLDMASEMMTFVKNNIISQAAQAMLSQASQLPGGILQLLR